MEVAMTDPARLPLVARRSLAALRDGVALEVNQLAALQRRGLVERNSWGAWVPKPSVLRAFNLEYPAP